MTPFPAVLRLWPMDQSVGWDFSLKGLTTSPSIP